MEIMITDERGIAALYEACGVCATAPRKENGFIAGYDRDGGKWGVCPHLKVAPLDRVAALDERDARIAELEAVLHRAHDQFEYDHSLSCDSENCITCDIRRVLGGKP
jgi:hypothetical protein